MSISLSSFDLDNIVGSHHLPNHSAFSWPLLLHIRMRSFLLPGWDEIIFVINRVKKKITKNECCYSLKWKRNLVGSIWPTYFRAIILSVRHFDLKFFSALQRKILARYKTVNEAWSSLVLRRIPWNVADKFQKGHTINPYKLLEVPNEFWIFSIYNETNDFKFSLSNIDISAMMKIMSNPTSF